MKTPLDAAPIDPCVPSRATSVALRVEPSMLRRFFRILQQGFTLRTRLGRSVGTVLLDELGLSREFLDSKVQTLFLNGKTIDDPDSAFVSDRAVIALSSAMPGLVGATLRRGSAYAAMRSQITYSEPVAPVAEVDGNITVKIYNLLLDELGAALLQRSILVARDTLAGFLKEQDQDLWNACASAAVDGCRVEPRVLPEILSAREACAEDLVRLTIASNA